MKDVKRLTESTAFRIGVIGAAATDRFAQEIAALGLKPKHAGLLAILDSGGPAAQLDLAAVMHVAPSLMVAFADHLEGLGAVQRVRDPADRRRQVVSLTAAGRRLLAKCASAAQRLDDEMLAELSAEQRRLLAGLLGEVARDNGLAITEY